MSIIAAKGVGGPDGLKVDSAGNLWATGPGGIRILSPLGKVLGFIRMPAQTANLAFAGADGKMVYITSSGTIYRLRSQIAGNMPEYSGGGSAAAGASGPAVASRADSPDPALTLINQRCTGCHGTEQVFIQRKTPEEWADTVEKMINLGTDLNYEEEVRVIRYLAEHYAPVDK